MRDRDLLDQRSPTATAGAPPRLSELWAGDRADRLVGDGVSFGSALVRLAQRLAATAVDQPRQCLNGLHWHTLKTLDRHRLEASVGAFEPGEVCLLVMDESALHKCHRYASVIMDAERTRAL